MSDSSTAPGWIALAVAAVSGVAQGFVALVQKPKEKKAESVAAQERHLALVQYVDQELSAAARKFSDLRRVSTGSFPSLQTLAGLESDVQAMQTRLALIERERELEREEREEERRVNRNIQLELREIVTTLRFIVPPRKGPST